MNSASQGDEVLGLLVLAFEGRELPAGMQRRLTAAPAAGVTLFRYVNIGTPSEVRGLTDQLQRAAAARDAAAGGAAAHLPLLIAADQEGGQLQGLGGATTPFAGNMAIGAVGDTALAERVGSATARELLALGVNVAYAPVCDLATNPDNPAIGIRSFGDDPAAAGAMAAAVIRGLRAAGVAAPVIGFPRGATESLIEPYVKATGVQAVGLGTGTSPALGRRLQRTVAIQGALDPQLLLAGGPALDAGVDALLAAWGDGPWIFNLGHGVLPTTPVEHIGQVVERVTGWRRP